MARQVTPKQFQRFVNRDKYCLHCGTTETLIPHHRLNRGMGGSKARDVPSNIIVICARFNGEMEAFGPVAHAARLAGFKLLPGQKPEEEPVLDVVANTWYRLDDKFGRFPAEEGKKE